MNELVGVSFKKLRCDQNVISLVIRGNIESARKVSINPTRLRNSKYLPNLSLVRICRV